MRGMHCCKLAAADAVHGLRACVMHHILGHQSSRLELNHHDSTVVNTGWCIGSAEFGIKGTDGCRVKWYVQPVLL